MEKKTHQKLGCRAISHPELPTSRLDKRLTQVRVWAFSLIYEGRSRGLGGFSMRQ